MRLLGRWGRCSAFASPPCEGQAGVHLCPRRCQDLHLVQLLTLDTGGLEHGWRLLPLALQQSSLVRRHEALLWPVFTEENQFVVAEDPKVTFFGVLELWWIASTG